MLGSPIAFFWTSYYTNPVWSSVSTRFLNLCYFSACLVSDTLLSVVFADNYFTTQLKIIKRNKKCTNAQWLGRGCAKIILFMTFSSKGFYSVVEPHSRSHWEEVGVLIFIIHTSLSYCAIFNIQLYIVPYIIWCNMNIVYICVYIVYMCICIYI